MLAPPRRALPPTWRGARLILALAGLFLLAACAQVAQLARAPTNAPPVAAQVAEAYPGPGTEPAPPQTAEAYPGPGTEPAVDPFPPAPAAQARAAPRRHPIDANPSRLMGLDPTQVTAILGTPTFVRREEGGEIWQYREHGCILDLFLYRDGETARVDHFELREARDGAPLTVASARRGCFGELLLRDGAVLAL